MVIQTVIEHIENILDKQYVLYSNSLSVIRSITNKFNQEDIITKIKNQLIKIKNTSKELTIV